MGLDHNIQYEGNSSCHQGEMHEDGLIDGLADRGTARQTDRLDPFLYSLIPLRQSGE